MDEDEPTRDGYKEALLSAAGKRDRPKAPTGLTPPAKAALGRKEDPAQQKGKQLDQAIAKTQKNTKDEHALEKSGKKIDEAAQKINQKIKEQKPGEKAGKQFDKAIEQATDNNSSN